MSESNDPIVVGRGKRSDGSRLKVLLGAGAALVALALGLPLVMTTGSGSSDTVGVSNPTPSTTTTSVPAEPAPVGTPRDPFRGPASLSVARSESNTSTVSSATPTASTTTGGATPTVTSPSPTTTPSSGSTAPSPAVTPAATYRLFLLEVTDGGTAYVRVDDQVMYVAVNDSFGCCFSVVSLDVVYRCGVFNYGDRRVSLCEGEEAVL